MKITVTFDDFTVGEYDTIEEAEDAILEADSEGVHPDYVEDDEDGLYSCIWTVKLQKES